MKALSWVGLAGLVVLCASAQIERPNAHSAVRQGEKEFRAGNIAASIKAFEEAVQLAPEVKPHLWQLAIAYYYAGRFAEARDLFEQHQTVNDQDVENAAWHFLCVARLDGLETARKKLIPITRDSRVPMKQIHALFAGKGTAQEVLAAAQGRQAGFYAHLYLGLYEEAVGEKEKSLTHIRKAAHNFSQPHYMGDLARVHLKLRTEK